MLLQASKRLRKFFNQELTNEMIWHEIIHEGKLHNIYQLTSLNAEAAYHLIKNEKRLQLLSLGITVLTPQVAKELAQYKGDKLFLNCIYDLTTDSAKALSQFRGAKLSLNGLKTISLPVIGRLASYKGIIQLDGVEIFEITEQDSARAETVFNHLNFLKISMEKIKNPSKYLLKALSTFPGQIELNGLENLTEEEAAILTTHIGNTLSLKGLKILTQSIQILLEQYNGTLDLSNAIKIDNKTLSVISKISVPRLILNPELKKEIEDYKNKLSQNNTIETDNYDNSNEASLIPEVNLNESQILEEFSRFDKMKLTIPKPITRTANMEEGDDFENSVSEDVLEDIEINLNVKIIKKKRKVDELMAMGINRLTSEQKQQLLNLNREIDELKESIRSALDILIERKELGSVVFNNSNDLIAYLKAAPENDDNDALEDIENKELFSGSFINDNPTNDIMVVGEDFIMQ